MHRDEQTKKPTECASLTNCLGNTHCWRGRWDKGPHVNGRGSTLVINNSSLSIDPRIATIDPVWASSSTTKPRGPKCPTVYTFRLPTCSLCLHHFFHYLAPFCVFVLCAARTLFLFTHRQPRSSPSPPLSLCLYVSLLSIVLLYVFLGHIHHPREEVARLRCSRLHFCFSALSTFSFP